MRAWVDTDDEKVDPPEETERGRGQGAGAGRARRRCRASPASRPGRRAAEAAAPTSRSPTRSGRSSRRTSSSRPTATTSTSSAASCRRTARCRRTRTRASGDPPLAAGGERSTTSWHYQCGNSGAIDLNYARQREGDHRLADRLVPQARLQHAVAGREPLRPHPHQPARRRGRRRRRRRRGGPAAAHRCSRSSSSTGTRRRRPGSARGFVGGPGGIPFGPPDPQVAHAIVPGARPHERLGQGAARGVGDGDRRVRREEPLDWGDRDSHGAVPAAADAGLGHARADAATRTTRPRSSCAAAKKIEHRYSDPGVLAQKVQSSDLPRALRPARRPGGGAQRQVLRLMRAPASPACSPSASRSRAAAAARRARARGVDRRPRRRGARRVGAAARRDAAAARATRAGARAALASGAIGVVDLANRVAIEPRADGRQPRAARSTGCAGAGWGSRRRRPAAATSTTLICDPNCAHRDARARRAP